MSVRRLAEDAIQPASFAFNRAFGSQAKTWIAKYPKDRKQSAVIPLLMLAQEQDGWVTKAAIEHVAQMLEMPYIRVLEVATFYTQFQLKPVGTKARAPGSSVSGASSGTAARRSMPAAPAVS